MELPKIRSRIAMTTALRLRPPEGRRVAQTGPGGDGHSMEGFAAAIPGGRAESHRGSADTIAVARCPGFSRRHPAAHADGAGLSGLVDCLRQCRESASGPRPRTLTGDGGANCPGRKPDQTAAPAVCGEYSLVNDWRTARPGICLRRHSVFA